MSVTWDALERQKRPLAEIKSYYGAYHKNFNEDRLMLLAAKCRPMDLVSRKIKYMGMFVWTPYGSAVKGHFGRDGRNFVNFLLPCV